jgi:hypothetical protein
MLLTFLIYCSWLNSPYITDNFSPMTAICRLQLRRRWACWGQDYVSQYLMFEASHVLTQPEASRCDAPRPRFPSLASAYQRRHGGLATMAIGRYYRSLLSLWYSSAASSLQTLVYASTVLASMILRCVRCACAITNRGGWRALCQTTQLFFSFPDHHPVTDSYFIQKQIRKHWWCKQIFVSFQANSISFGGKLYDLLEAMLIETIFITLKQPYFPCKQIIQYYPLEAILVCMNICYIVSSIGSPHAGQHRKTFFVWSKSHYIDKKIHHSWKQ